MRMRWPYVLLGLLAAPASAQVTVPDDVTCAGCTVALRDVVRLPVSSTLTPTEVVEDEAGRYWVVFVNELPIVYSGDGSIARDFKFSTAARDIRFASAVAPIRGDSMVLFDGASTAFHILDAELNVGRSVTFDRRVGGLAMLPLGWPDEVVVSASQPIVAGADAPYAIFSFEGASPRLVRQFGGLPARRLLAPAPADGFWSWSAPRYEIEKWSSSGDLVTRIDRGRPSWWHTESGGADPLSSPPAPRVSDVYEDPEGRLWVFVNTPAPTWRQAYARWNASERTVAGSLAYDQVYRTTIEVIDLQEGRVIARTMLDRWVASVLDDGRVAIYERDSSGAARVRVVQLRLEEPD